MPIVHDWLRPRTLDPDRFAAWSNDVQRVIDALPPTMIRGESGFGEPIITASLVAFNGNAHYDLHHDPNAIAIYSDPARLAEYRVAGNVEEVQFSCDAFGPFSLARVYEGLDARPGHAVVWELANTHARPYDIAVIAALILFNHHFLGTVTVTSDYHYTSWKPGLALAERATGRSLFIPFYAHVVQRPRILPAPRFRAWRDEVARVIATTDVPIAGPDGTGAPILTDAVVAFNGVGIDGHDPLRISQVYDPADGGFAMDANDWPSYYLQTMGNAGKRYDEVVTAALILLKDHFPEPVSAYGSADEPVAGVVLRGDDDDDEGWLAGLRLAERAMGRSLTLPRRL